MKLRYIFLMATFVLIGFCAAEFNPYPPIADDVPYSASVWSNPWIQVRLFGLLAIVLGFTLGFMGVLREIKETN